MVPVGKLHSTRSEVMQDTIALCDLYSRVDRPILLVGPVGSGKTSLAQRIHDRSRRRGRLIAVSTGELTESLFSDVLFGHQAGAFTGASRSRPGAMREAGSGTLLLDDLAVMPAVVQAAILRVLESGRYRPLGASADETVGCRLIFASTESPSVLVRSGTLLRDLASRLGDFVVRVPALVERREDIPDLAHWIGSAFLREHGSPGELSFESGVIERLITYGWPMNVRELKSVIERAVVHAGILGAEVVVRDAHLPARIQVGNGEEDSLVRLSSDLVRRVLTRTGGNQSEAARRLGVHRNTIARYLNAEGE